MKIKLDSGREFETLSFLRISFDPNEPVFKYEFKTRDRVVKSTPQHKWMVWDEKKKKVKLIEMENISVEDHSLITENI